MRVLKAMAALLCLGLLSVVFSPSAVADNWDQSTKITFNQPVEIPGQVLPAGTYYFRLMNSSSDRNIVQIFNEDRTHLYATILAIPDYRLQPSDQPVLMFEERPKDSPEAIKAWFYPGENYGHEFVYSRSRALELAQSNQQTVLAAPSEMAENTTPPTENGSVVGVTPQGNEVGPNEAAQSEPSATSQKATSESNQTQETTKELPKTASPLPLVALMGFIAVSAGLGLRFLSKKVV